MVKANVLVYGKELQTVLSTSYELSVQGKAYAIIFIKEECINKLFFDASICDDNKTIVFSGKELDNVFKSQEVIVLVGDIDKITFISPKGDIVSSYKVNDCNAEETFTEIN